MAWLSLVPQFYLVPLLLPVLYLPLISAQFFVRLYKVAARFFVHLRRDSAVPKDGDSLYYEL